MKAFTSRLAALLFVAALPAVSVHAQMEGLLHKGGASGLKGMAGGIPGITNITSGSVGNVAGLLEYCTKNNYLGGQDAAAVKDKLMGKVPGATPTADPGYTDGAKGVLKDNGGKQFDLNSIKGDATKQVCESVLSQGKSLL